MTFCENFSITHLNGVVPHNKSGRPIASSQIWFIYKKMWSNKKIKSCYSWQARKQKKEDDVKMNGCDWIKSMVPNFKGSQFSYTYMTQLLTSFPRMNLPDVSFNAEILLHHIILLNIGKIPLNPDNHKHITVQPWCTTGFNISENRVVVLFCFLPRLARLISYRFQSIYKSDYLIVIHTHIHTHNIFVLPFRHLKQISLASVQCSYVFTLCSALLNIISCLCQCFQKRSILDLQYIGWDLTQTDALYKLHLLSKTKAEQKFTFFKNMGEKLAVFFFYFWGKRVSSPCNTK